MTQKRGDIIGYKVSTRTERLALERLVRNLHALYNEDTFDRYVKDLAPAAWRTLEEDIDVTEKKVRVTLLLDESVAKYYRAMGRGYQARINRILATYAQLKIVNANIRQAEIREEFPDLMAAKTDPLWENLMQEVREVRDRE